LFSWDVKTPELWNDATMKKKNDMLKVETGSLSILPGLCLPFFPILPLEEVKKKY
jgi:hypothetical protein